jgi:hypothetical protein
MSPSIPSGAVFDNRFHTAIGEVEAGTSFALQLTATSPALLVTCQHLFGPAGGISKDVPPSLMSQFVPSVTVKDALGSAITARARAALAVPGADAHEPARDLAAFPLEPNPAINPLRLARSVEPNQRVFLAARLRQGAAAGAYLFPAEIIGDTSEQTVWAVFEDAAIHLPGTSGAPVITASGELVGMMVRFRQRDGMTAGELLTAATIESMLAPITVQPPQKPSLLRRLFG